MIEETNEKILLKFIPESTMVISKKEIIKLSKELSLLILNWNTKEIKNGHSFVFLTKEVEKISSTELIKKVNIEFNIKIDKYKLKKSKDYTFFYYTIL